MVAESWKIVEIVFLVQVGVLILFGNCLVILAFFKGRRHIRTYTNYFVVNLAISDLLVGCLSLPFWIAVLLDAVKEGDNSFQFFLMLDILFGTTSILSLTAISLERMFAVKYPTKHFNLSSRPVYLTIGATWFSGFLVCSIRFVVDQKPFSVIVLFLAFLIPLSVIVVSYLLIFATARKLMKASKRSRDISREIQVAKTISVIIGLFVVCWLPFFVVNLVFMFCTDFKDETTCQRFDAEYAWLVSVAKGLHYSNSMMNFFVYAVKSPDFRETFKVMIFNRCNTNKLRQRLRTISQSYRVRSASKKTLDSNEDSNNIMYKSSPRIIALRYTDEEKARLAFAGSQTIVE